MNTSHDLAGDDPCAAASSTARAPLRLKDRILDCLPAGRYAFTALLRLLDVVETDAVPTAAVECRAQPRLLVNPGFVARHAETPEKLMMLVMHELHHLLLGHTRRLPAVTPADNLVLDAVINALLAKMFPQPEYLALLTDFYDEDAFPQCLLRPPPLWGWGSGWGRGALSPAQVPLPSGLRRPFRGAQAAREVYRALYSSEGASEADLRRLVPLLGGAAAKGVALLGDHQHSARGEATDSSRLMAEAVAGVVRTWPTPPEPLKGRSLEGMLQEARLLPHRKPGNRALLRGLIERIAGVGGAGPQRRWPRTVELDADSPIPTLSRRTVVLRALGAPAMLHPARVPHQAPQPDAEPVRLYLDVSGSMDGLRESLYGAALDCRAWLHPVVHLFSTQVEDVTLAELAAGVCRTTGGTDLRCVIEHMRRHRVRRAVLVTDGYVGAPAGADAQVLQAVRLGVAYVPGHDTRALRPYCGAEVLLDANEEKRT